MAILETVDDASTAYLEVSFYDEDGSPVTPTSITYRIDTDTGTQIRSNTSISPAPTVTITLTRDDNKCLTTSDQVNIVTIQAVWSTNNQIISEYRYIVKHIPKRNLLYT
ncbi:MAG: hypothetical protein QXQ53_01185 [Candidatus Methanosuratincola sp.]